MTQAEYDRKQTELCDRLHEHLTGMKAVISRAQDAIGSDPCTDALAELDQAVAIAAALQAELLELAQPEAARPTYQPPCSHCGSTKQHDQQSCGSYDNDCQ